jgi:hypothetical protein
VDTPTAEEQPAQRATGWSRRIRLSDATRLAVISSTISAVIGAVATIVVAGMTGNEDPAPLANPPATQVTSQPSPTLPLIPTSSPSLSPTPFAIPSGPLDPCVIGTWHGVLKDGQSGGFTLTLAADGAGSQQYDQWRSESDVVQTVNRVVIENGTSRFKFGTADGTVAFELESGDYLLTSTTSAGIWPFRQSTTRTNTADSNLIGLRRYLCTADRFVLTYPDAQVEYHR